VAWKLLGATLWVSRSSGASQAPGGFVAHRFRGLSGSNLPYRLFVPDPSLRDHSLPLIVFLHGIAGAGIDNRRQLEGGNCLGSRVWTTGAAQARHPAYVLAPQIPTGSAWADPKSPQLAPYTELVVELLSQLGRTYPIDTDRIYAVGQSLGGMGVWDLITKRPDLFAAAVPVCGNGNSSAVSRAKSVPVWAFHGAWDEVVPVAGSREMVAALKAAGGTVKYTEYPDGHHDVWTRVFAEPSLSEWLFAQKRGRRLTR
jgi:predicted peptidase